MMMTSKWVPYGSLAAVALTAVLVGCGDSATQQDAVWAEAGRQYLFSEEPPDAQQVMKLRELLGESGQLEDVTLVGRVDGLGQPTWDPDRAAFMLADLSLTQQEVAHDGAPKHDTDNCPFCKARTKKELSGLALVQIVDKGGEVPPVDAQILLGLSRGQTVVIRGDATLDKLGTLLVRSEGVYVKPDLE